MRSFCLIVLFAAIAAIDAQTPRGPPHAFPTLEPVETTEPQDPIETEFPNTGAPVGKYPFLMRGGRPDTPDAVEQDRPADFINFGGNGGTPFRGFKKPTAADAKSITGKTIAIIMSTLFVVAAAAVVAVIIIRKKRSA